MNITLSMPPKYVERLKEEREKTGMTYSEIIRRALDEYTERVKRRDRL